MVNHHFGNNLLFCCSTSIIWGSFLSWFASRLLATWVDCSALVRAVSVAWAPFSLTHFSNTRFRQRLTWSDWSMLSNTSTGTRSIVPRKCHLAVIPCTSFRRSVKSISTEVIQKYGKVFLQTYDVRKFMKLHAHACTDCEVYVQPPTNSALLPRRIRSIQVCSPFPYLCIF